MEHNESLVAGGVNPRGLVTGGIQLHSQHTERQSNNESLAMQEQMEVCLRETTSALSTADGHEGSLRCKECQADERRPMGGLVPNGMKTGLQAVKLCTGLPNCYIVSILQKECVGNGSQLRC